MATIGLKNLYYAIMQSDTSGGTTYGTPVKIAGAIQVDINPQTSTNTLNADDMPFYVANSMSQIDVTVNTAQLPASDVAALLGHHLNADGGIDYASSDVAPYVAIMGQSEKADGNVRYFKLYKGKFIDSQETLQTKGDNVEYTTPQLTGSFVARVSDGKWKTVLDSEDLEEGSTAIENWFSQV